MSDPEIRKVPVVLTVTDELLAQAREDFIAIYGMTPEEFHAYTADAMAKALDRIVEEGE